MSKLRRWASSSAKNVVYHVRKGMMAFGITNLTSLYPGSIVYKGASGSVPPTLAPDGLPFPPMPLAYRVGGTDYEGFFQVGSAVKQRILQALPEDFRFEGKRIYEFGCGSGRVLRHFLPEAQTCEFWGSDINYSSIEWMTEHLSPPFYVFHNTEYPVLPLESNSFDLVFAISVFSHIHVNWSQWMMELRRILKPGGYLFCTFLGPNIFEDFLLRPYKEGEYGMFVKNLTRNWNRGGPTVFLSPEWVKTYWGSLFDIEMIALGGLTDAQSIALMRKPLREGQPFEQKEIPVLQMGFTHAVNPNARGSIVHSYPTGRRLIEGYGIRGNGHVPLKGSISFKNDKAAEMQVTINGQVVATFSAAKFEVIPTPSSLGRSTPILIFNEQIDVSGIQAGSYELKASFRSQKGKTYWLAIPLIIEA